MSSITPVVIRSPIEADIGVDLTPPAPDAQHAPRVYAPLHVWLERSEEIHAFREQAHRAERAQRRVKPRLP